MSTLRKSTFIAALFAAAPLAHAGSDFEWIKRQLAISEGSAEYAQPATEPAGRTTTESRSGNARFEFYQRQLRLSDGAAPNDRDAGTAEARRD